MWFATSIESLITWIEHHAFWGQFCVFLLAWVESLAIIGSVIPGSIIMFAVGGLIGSGVLPMVTLLWIFIGALVGDYMSYYFGLYCQQTLLTHRWMQRFSKVILQGKQMIKQYGSIGIIVGRFVGVCRSVVPMIAGILDMPPLQFSVAIFFSALLWTIAYTVPGILIGRYALELPMASLMWCLLYLVLALVAVVILWRVVGWLIGRLLRWNRWAAYRGYFYLRQYYRREVLVKWCGLPVYWPERMLYLLLIPVVLLAFLGLGLSGPESIISQVNIACYHLVLDMQSPALMKVLLIGSYGAQKKVLLVAVMAITLILAGQKNWQACLLTVAYIALAGGLIICSKHGFVSPRPPIFEEMLSPFSYPSGHVAFFTAITAWVLALGGLSRRYWPLYLKWQSVAILLVAFTRVGLGHHWLFDAVGGYLLGMLPLLLLRMVIINHTVRWQWHHYAVVVFSYLLAWGGYAHKHLAMDLQWCKVETPVVQNIDMVAWWQHQQVLPAMRDNRFGQPVAPFNVQWHGDIERIEDTLTTAGWSSLALNDPLWLRLLHAVDKQYLWPSFPGRWHHQMPRLMMVSPQGQVLILWDSHYRIAGTPLWIGAIDEDMAELAGGIEPDWQLDHTELLPWQQQAMVWMIRSQS